MGHGKHGGVGRVRIWRRPVLLLFRRQRFLLRQLLVYDTRLKILRRHMRQLNLGLMLSLLSRTAVSHLGKTIQW